MDIAIHVDILTEERVTMTHEERIAWCLECADICLLLSKTTDSSSPIFSSLYCQLAESLMTIFERGILTYSKVKIIQTVNDIEWLAEHSPTEEAYQSCIRVSQILNEILKEA